ncbi:unnamed protein product [Effrenium voratum]|uniref:Uncharacterized protein n=1 Tax=Effrenium voratum TaxID=2562239 RepID=A0AA36MXE4_9DINO|nr:unnamed protein product [Effrenium voratum]
MVPGLEEELGLAGLERCLVAAMAWCEEMGPRDLEEIAEEDVFEDFCSALKLKPLERRRLLKGRLGRGRAGYGGAPKEAAASEAAPKAVGQAFVVKNTFLELDDDEVRTALQRSSTTPAPTSPLEPEDEDAQEAEDAEETEEAGGATASAIYKTLTFDSWENGNDWDWIHRNQLEAVMEQPSEEFAQDPEAEVGMMLIPMEAMPGYMPMPEMCFTPGCFAVPMDRFGRFPGVMDQLPIPDTTIADNKRAQVLQRAFSVASNVYRIRWTVDARKLKSTDKEAVSPPFDLTFSGGAVPFKMIMRPRVVAQERGGASFRRSRGRGNIQLRCMAESDTDTKPVVTFRLGVGSDKAAKQLKPRGPVRHDFSEKNICGLPRGQDDWDFGKAVDEKTQTFVVCLEILSGE